MNRITFLEGVVFILLIAMNALAQQVSESTCDTCSDGTPCGDQNNINQTCICSLICSGDPQTCAYACELNLNETNVTYATTTSMVTTTIWLGDDERLTVNTATAKKTKPTTTVTTYKKKSVPATEDVTTTSLTNDRTASDSESSGPLVIEVVSPKADELPSSVKEVQLRVKRSDGVSISDSRMQAFINKDTVVLTRTGDIFSSPYYVPGNQSHLDIRVSDKEGRIGETSIKLANTASQGSIWDLVILAVVVAILGFFGLMFLVGVSSAAGKTGNEDSTRSEQYNEVRERIKSLRSKEEKMLAGWVAEKLKKGEDPQALKKGLKDEGYDSGLVDEVQEDISKA